jgi:hypothetical protein
MIWGFHFPSAIRLITQHKLVTVLVHVQRTPHQSPLLAFTVRRHVFERRPLRVCRARHSGIRYNLPNKESRGGT